MLAQEINFTHSHKEIENGTTSKINYKANEEQRRRDSSWGAGYGFASDTGVEGVKTKRDETRGGRELTTKQYFGRDGTTLTNSSLNI